jgi:CRP/FNR family cyclic AMP-dependent transcriptional regulator
VAERKQPAGSAQILNFAAGATIFAAGERADQMYIVQEGQVECFAGDRLINTVGPGGILGEMALINHQPRSATARAKSDVELKALDEARFLDSVKTNPYFALEVMRTLADRLRRQTAS